MGIRIFENICGEQNIELGIRISLRVVDVGPEMELNVKYFPSMPKAPDLLCSVQGFMGWKSTRAGNVTQSAEGLPSMHEVLGLIPSIP